tara:strand:+ start:144 stop:671 length:528 start_codon:yes stop_codon:yes gene_type:complete
MIEAAGSVVLTIFLLLMMRGYSEEKKRLQKHTTQPTLGNLSRRAEADLYAAYTYQETGEPSAFMLFDYEEPVVARPATQKPKANSRPKPKSNVSAQDKKIKSLENQIKQLQKMVAKQQLQPVKNAPKIHPLQEDCVDALVALGYNKTEAKKIVKNSLTDSVDTLQDFLVIAMRKG